MSFSYLKLMIRLYLIDFANIISKCNTVLIQIGLYHQTIRELIRFKIKE